MNPVHQELLQIEAALDRWRQDRGWVAYGCGQAEHDAFAAGYVAGIKAVDQVAQARYLVPHDG